MAQAKDRILVVDDAPDTLEVLERNLTAQGFEVFTAPSVREAVKVLEARSVEVVITDLKMPGVSGLELVRHVRENYRDTEALMITGYPTVEGAVQAVKSGADNFLPKPFTDEELQRAVGAAVDKLRSRRALQGELRVRGPLKPGLFGESEAMRRVFAALSRAMASDAAVLILGEGGSGKELAARAVHYGGSRSSSPFVSVNLAAIPAEHAEGELFGQVGVGSKLRPGFFSAAEGGTLFLDEVAQANPALQARLVQALEERSLRPVGAVRDLPMDVRVVASSTKDLVALSKKGSFREDLLYRISVIGIELPPLRARGDDVLLLANHFSSRFAAEASKVAPAFTDRAAAVLRSYEWPGNVRELEQVVQRLVVLSDGQPVDVPDLPNLMRFSALKEKTLHRTLAQVEAEYIKSVLGTVDGNRTRAAEILGIDRKTLREKMKRADKEPELT
jgi:DNA-binding NtrC family response regulator